MQTRLHPAFQGIVSGFAPPPRGEITAQTVSQQDGPSDDLNVALRILRVQGASLDRAIAALAESGLVAIARSIGMARLGLSEAESIVEARINGDIKATGGVN